MRKKTYLKNVSAALTIMLGLLIFVNSVNGAAGQPFYTIPALQEWTNGSGTYTFNSSRRIMINGSGLSNEGSVFAADLLNLSGYTIPVVTGSSPAAGDIYLTLGSTDPLIGNEGYVMTITDRITIEAKTTAGAFYGTRTVLQALKQSYSIAAGTARDWPMYRLRGMHTDNGRKYFTPAWLRDHIRELAYLKMNVYHWHISDDQGFRIELFNHPEVPTAPYLTQAEIASLLNLAAQYHVTIIPEIDMPGHLLAALRSHPELWAQGTNAGELDMGIDASYVFVQQILDELLPLFPGPYWHIGADEYNGGFPAYYATYAQQHFCTSGTASPQDAFIGFMNYVNGIVKSHGKTSWCWHEPMLIEASGQNTCTTLDYDIVIDFWNAAPDFAIARGNLVFNSNRWKTYYVLGGASTTGNKIYSQWDPAIFAGLTIEDAHPSNLGGKGLHIWCDTPGAETEAQIANNVYELIRAAAQNEWNSPKLAGRFNSFQPIIAAIGRSPCYGEHLAPPDDTTPPSPNPMTWATAPYATGSTSIAMVATTATDVSGVQYYFDCTSTGGHDSAWQTGTSYTDTGLSAGTQYCYRVQARDNSTNQNTTGWSTTLCATTTQPDTTPPTPNPMTWSVLPYAPSSSSISMTATTATDASGVQYFFDCTSTGGHDSGWQSGTTYTDTGLSAGTQYCYRVQARDLSPNQNTTTWSTTQCATTQTGGDTTPPTPNPMTWATVPYATGQTSVAMVATTATDASGVEYYFDCTTAGGHDSAWQSGTSYTDTGLSPATQYCYRVQARDLSANQNTTTWSTTLCATTQSGGGGSVFFDGFEDGALSPWTPTASCSVTSGSAYQGTYKVFIKLVSSMETSVSTSGYTGIHLKFAAWTNGFDAGEYVTAQWYDGSSWQTADQMVSQGSYTLRDITLPAGAANNPNFRIRLSTNSSQNTEWAYIDNVEVTGQ